MTPDPTPSYGWSPKNGPAAVPVTLTLTTLGPADEATDSAGLTSRPADGASVAETAAGPAATAGSRLRVVRRTVPTMTAKATKITTGKARNRQRFMVLPFTRSCCVSVYSSPAKVLVRTYVSETGSERDMILLVARRPGTSATDRD